jgi:fatty-acyl-CoA synthase
MRKAGKTKANNNAVKFISPVRVTIMKPTPTENELPLRVGGFATLVGALEYAAQGDTGFNFYSSNGKLQDVLTYSGLKKKSQAIAGRLLTLGLEPGARVALIAETDPDFIIFFFACHYAGMVPVPLPAPNTLGGRTAYESLLKRLLKRSGTAVAIAAQGFFKYLFKAAQGLKLHFLGTPDMFDALSEEQSGLLIPPGPKDMAYIQFTSGSTRFPRGVMITHEAVLTNLTAILNAGLCVQPGDRAMSWLPFYHDMGLVGLVLGTMTAQLSVDFLKTNDFAMRPWLWLKIMSRNRATLSFSPMFGYELCARWLEHKENHSYDLSAWRVAGVGAEMIRKEPLEKFASLLSPSGFKPKAMTTCYGMAECSLAICFAPLGQGIKIDCVESDLLSEQNEALAGESKATESQKRLSFFVNCGKPLPDYEIEIRDNNGRSLPERHCGILFVRGLGVMEGYLGDIASTREVLSQDGWLNTGDLAYRVGDTLVITGRVKDMIIINGRNIWPQDLEYLVERQPEIRDSCAFSVPDKHGTERVVVVIVCRLNNSAIRTNLVKLLHGLIHKEFGIECRFEVVPRNSIPRTTSGKLSRSATRRDYLNRIAATAAGHGTSKHNAKGQRAKCVAAAGSGCQLL